MTIQELREKRNTAWNAAKAFLESHRTEKGTLTAEDDATYTRMEQDIADLGKEIARLERQEALDAETWMDAHTAVDLGFADEIMARPADAGAENHAAGPMLFSRAAVTNHLMDKLAAKCRIEKKPTKPERSVDDLMERLNLMTH